jgi:hypothetical protein
LRSEHEAIITTANKAAIQNFIHDARAAAASSLQEKITVVF